ncbi:MAG: hypothetical protein JWN45_2456 [Acidobacteriaceae bacterium]|nr:hypothetical protein [Acidobacteriaceae bacterium]
MRKYDVHKIGLVVAMAILIALASGCGKMQSRERGAKEQGGQSASAGNAQTVEGCVIRRESAFYIQPAAGDKTKLNSGGQDLDSHVGKNVRVSGNMNNSGSQSGNAQSPTGATGTDTGTAEPELLVTRVDVIADTCPPDIQRRADADKNKSTPK